MPNLFSSRFAEHEIPRAFVIKRSPIPAFYALEGPDDVGKSTIIAKIVELMRDRGGPTPYVHREPAGSVLGQLALDEMFYGDCGSLGQALTFVGLMAYHWETVVKPVLDDGGTVISDRHFPSTLVYQAWGSKHSSLILNAVNALLDLCKGHPHVILLREESRTDDELAFRYTELAARFGWPVVEIGGVGVDEAARRVLDVIDNAS